ncbi:Hypothetical predicted protein [Mytilus galloprovincialis]|uniref:Uncharacterized protein n=1 Tax=Mytilus galloprovincialis TaxID=29158 RepID=A0A8B6BLU3_MYTGA|nr:Hypothetical predicted protein [Mytilus galloprovincialis]
MEFVGKRELPGSGRCEETQDNHIRLLEQAEAQDNHVRKLEAETEEEEARRRIAARKAARSEPIIKWKDLSEEFFKITEVKEFEGQWGKSQILTLERRGTDLKVWACDRARKEVTRLLQRRKLPLWLENNGMEKAKKSGHNFFDI